jgi:hypothetical protein
MQKQETAEHAATAKQGFCTMFTVGLKPHRIPLPPE